jgi:ABC-type multidrug transport system fused ATPase/permease subunit
MPKIMERLSALAAFWRKGRISWVLVALLVLSVIFFGLHDVGLILGITAAIVIMIELTHRWRRAWNFIILFFTTFLGIILLSFLDVEVVKPFVRLFGGADAVNETGFQVFNHIVSLSILFFGAAGLIVGFFGALVLGAW